LILNPTQWQNDTGFKKNSLFFLNQTSFMLTENKNEGNNFQNPFSSSKDNALG
jgi:hypothetical protein